jgi:hypothetical protein
MADIAIDDTHIILLLRHEIGNMALNEGHKNAKTSVSNGGSENRSDARSIFFKDRLYGQANASLDPLPCKIQGAMDCRHPLRVALNCLHNSLLVPPSR